MLGLFCNMQDRIISYLLRYLGYKFTGHARSEALIDRFHFYLRNWPVRNGFGIYY